MANAPLPSASALAERMREVARGEWPLNPHLEDISRSCLRWAEAQPDEISSAFRDFEEARLAVRRYRCDETWAKVKDAAKELEEALLRVPNI